MAFLWGFSWGSRQPCALLAVSLAASMPALAQERVAVQPTLPGVVVSGSRSEQRIEDLAASVEVLNPTQLEANQSGDLRDLAKTLPNVSVQRAPARFTLAGAPTGRDANAGINIRGLEGNRVLMLADGIRLPRSYVFGSNAFGRDTVDVTLLKRVELIKGPASALYGSDGLAGLVNFVTLEPRDFLSANRTLGGKAALAYSGDDNGVRASATVAGQASPTLQWLLTLGADRSRALENRGEVDTANTDRTTPNPQRNRGRAALGKLVFQPSKEQKHSLTLEYVDKKFDYELLSARTKPPLAATSILSAESFTTQTRDRFTWVGDFSWATPVWDQLQTVVSTQRAHAREYITEDRNTAADRVRDVTFDEKTLQLGVQANKTVRMQGALTGWTQQFTYGAEHVNTRVSNLNTGVTPPFGETFPLKRFPDTNETTQALYLQDEWISDAWSITPALRYDRFDLKADQAGFVPRAASLSGFATSPKLGVLWRTAPQWSVFSSYGAGFRAPNASQVNAFFENLTAFYKTIPNPDLKPEKSRSVELGVRGQWRGLAIEAAAFNGRYRDLIADSQQVGGAGVAGNPTVFQSVNIGQARIRGFEVKGDYTWVNGTYGKVSTPFAFGRTEGKDLRTGQPLNSINPAKLAVGLHYAATDWDLRFDAIRHAAKKAGDVTSAGSVALPNTQFLTPAATTLDLSGQWRIRKDVRLNLALNNLTNKKYWMWSDVRGLAASSTVADAYTQPGRHLNASLVVDF
jgi:hemoglobin/transferrin/lactoferrin receptor protein